MCLFSMLSSPFSVIGRQDGPGVVVPSTLPQELEELSHDLVDIGHFSRVRIGGERLVERGGRLIREMGLVEMDPAKPARAALLLEPRHGGLEDLGRRPLRHRERRVGRPFGVSIVVHLETLIDAEARVERKSSHEGSGAVSVLLQYFGQRGDALVQDEGPVVVYPVGEGIHPGEQAGMGGEGQGHMGNRTVEADPLLGQRVDVRRGNLCASVRAEVIRSQGVDGDDEEIRFHRGHIGRDDRRCLARGRSAIPKPKADQDDSRKQNGKEGQPAHERALIPRHFEHGDFSLRGRGP